ncbi:MAG: ABC transporter ATP-binding protein [Bacillota bacterium]
MLELRNISKRFGSVVANDAISLTVERGTVHAILGENGAGKTTLMNILFGLYRPDSGEILYDGRPVDITSPRVALEHGIGMIHQHFMLVPRLSVTENIVLGAPGRRGFLLDLAEKQGEIARLSETYGLEVDPLALAGELPVGVQQRVEILKALYRGAKVLILDEPTSGLSPPEIRVLLDILRRLRDAGHAVLFITHKLAEVLDVSDVVTVLRRGRVVGTMAREDADPKILATLMIGREIEETLPRSPMPRGREVLRLDDVHARDDQGKCALNGVTLSVHSNEIVGIAGVDGNGQRELAEVILGIRPVSRGRVLLKGEDAGPLSTRARLERNVAYVPEDRQLQGLLMDLPISDNLILKTYYRPPIASRGLISKSSVRRQAEDLIHRYDIRAGSPDIAVRLLSGGNQQKVVLARELSGEPELVVALQPTRGLDVGATEYVQRLILRQRENGAGILYISTELDEIFALSDRIAVMYAGRIVGVVDRKAANTEKIGMMMAGMIR